MILSEKYIRRFWSYVDIGDADECWLWQRGRANGYGSFTFIHGGTSKTVNSHRVAYLLGHNRQPGSLFVCHRCDVRLCCNPSHLFLGTNADNMRDMREKGRDRYVGERNPSAKLTESLVRDIRRRIESGEMLKNIAADIGVTPPLISQIKRGLIWKSVGAAE